MSKTIFPSRMVIGPPPESGIACRPLTAEARPGSGRRKRVPAPFPCSTPPGPKVSVVSTSARAISPVPGRPMSAKKRSKSTLRPFTVIRTGTGGWSSRGRWTDPSSVPPPYSRPGRSTKRPSRSTRIRPLPLIGKGPKRAAGTSNEPRTWYGSPDGIRTEARALISPSSGRSTPKCFRSASPVNVVLPKSAMTGFFTSSIPPVASTERARLRTVIRLKWTRPGERTASVRKAKSSSSPSSSFSRTVRQRKVAAVTREKVSDRAIRAESLRMTSRRPRHSRKR